MGYRGKVMQQNEAHRLRAKGLTMNEIAETLGVSKSSVSLWTRDVPFQPTLGQLGARRRGPNALQRASAFWSNLTGIPRSQFHKPYRAVADSSIRATKHEYGCVSVRYGCSRTHRAVMGLVDALLASKAIPG